MEDQDGKFQVFIRYMRVCLCVLDTRLALCVRQQIWDYGWSQWRFNHIANPRLRLQTSALEKSAERDWQTRRKWTKENVRTLKFIRAVMSPLRSDFQGSARKAVTSSERDKSGRRERVKCYLGGCIWICSDALDWTTTVLVPAWLVIRRMTHLCSLLI